MTTTTRVRRAYAATGTELFLTVNVGEIWFGDKNLSIITSIDENKLGLTWKSYDRRNNKGVQGSHIEITSWSPGHMKLTEAQAEYVVRRFPIDVRVPRLSESDADFETKKLQRKPLVALRKEQVRARFNYWVHIRDTEGAVIPDYVPAPVPEPAVQLELAPLAVPAEIGNTPVNSQFVPVQKEHIDSALEQMATKLMQSQQAMLAMMESNKAILESAHREIMSLHEKVNALKVRRVRRAPAATPQATVARPESYNTR